MLLNYVGVGVWLTDLIRGENKKKKIPCFNVHLLALISLKENFYFSEPNA